MTKNNIKKILQEIGPSRSSEIVKELMKREGVNKGAATQRVSRAPEDIKKLKDWLPKREDFLFLKEQESTKSFLEKFYKALLETESSYGIAIASIMSRGGIILSSEFKTISGAPEGLKKQLSYSLIKEKLVNNGFLIEEENSVLGLILRIPANLMSVDKTAVVKARLISESILLDMVKRWSEQNGFAASGSSNIRGVNKSRKKAGQFYWDIVAPSYLRPLVSREKNKKIKPAFFVCDINLNYSINKDQFSYFKKKVEMYENTSNSGKLLPMYITNYFDKDAFNLGKKMGIIVTTPKNIFGNEFVEALKKLSLLIQKTFEKVDEKNLDNLLKATIKYYETFSNLKGFTFEIMSAYITRLEEYGEVYLQKNIIIDGDYREIDILKISPRNNSLTFIECKSKEKDNLVSEEEAWGWIEKTKKINLWLKEEKQYMYRESTINYQMWTNTDFTEDAREVLKKINNGKQKHTQKNGEDILEIVTKTKDNKGLSNAIKSFF